MTPAIHTPAIQTEGLGKVYRSGFLRLPFTGLTGLDLHVPEGIAFGFVGPNGAGKTTTIKILMGLQSQTSGRAMLHGVPIENPESRRGVGFLPERPYFYEHLTANEFLDFYGRLYELSSADRRDRIPRLLERVGLSRFSSVPLGKFSKGMLQRAGLAQALISRPRLLVLDEPMSGLDPLGRALVRDIILEERRQGTTVFFSSHILSDVESMCDRVAMLVLGKLRGQGTLPELLGATVAAVECTFSGPPLALGTLLRADGDRRTIRVDAEALDATIDAIRAAGGHLERLEPLQKTLEEVLLSEVERARPVNQKELGVLA